MHFLERGHNTPFGSEFQNTFQLRPLVGQKCIPATELNPDTQKGRENNDGEKGHGPYRNKGNDGESRNGRVNKAKF